MSNINYLQESICFDLKIGSKLCSIVSINNRSPSQAAGEFENFLNKLNQIMESITQKNPFLTDVIADFNARSSEWWTDDKTIQEGLKIENLLSQFSLSKVINEPTDISQNFNSCVDLLFTNQHNLVTNSGIHSSFHCNCHHQIIYRKFNLNIFYPPPYERRRWIPNPGVPCSKPLGGSKVDSAFHPPEVDKMSTRNFWELSGKK